MKKKCSKCRITKSLCDFYKKSGSKDVYRSECKTCTKECNMNYVNKNQKRFKKSHHKAQLKFRYNITLDEYDKLFEEQNGVCAICGKPETAINKHGTVWRLSVDHKHNTNKIRGLLCIRCNRGIGFFEDNINYLINAINYLRSK